MRPRRRWMLSLLDAALSRVDEKVLPRLSRALTTMRARRPVPGRWATVGAVAMAVLAVALVVVAAVRPEPARPEGSSTVWVGVRDGDSVPAYLRLAESRLQALASQTPDHVGYALASFTDYLTPAQVAELLSGSAGLTGVRAYARVPVPGRQTEQVRLTAIRLPADLLSSMDEVASRKDADAVRYESLAEGEADGSLRQIYASNAEVSRTEAQAYRQGCACVFAVVVRGAAEDLAELAALPGLRAVDPALGVTHPNQAVFAPPLPEQVGRVTPPVDDGLPPDAGPSTVAPAW